MSKDDGESGGFFSGKKDRKSSLFRPAEVLKLENDLDFGVMDFESLIEDDFLKKESDKIDLSTVFTDYSYPIRPINSRYLQLNMHGFMVWKKEHLNRRKFSWPEYKEPKNYNLLRDFYKSRSFVGKMPHCRYSKPLRPKIRSSFSLLTSL